ncbi:MAG: hypothetical protein OFPII_38550 [Osedax symbiont Rs1]|nr:MAG: hypothetical protein OFPII_38550 [Osedax symbiont Rs1]
MRPQHDVASEGKTRQGKAKTGEIAEFTGVNEHIEPIFNAVSPSAIVMQRSHYNN